MKYAIIRNDGVAEFREDNYATPDNAILLTDEQYDQLICGEYIIQKGLLTKAPISAKGNIK